MEFFGHALELEEKPRVVSYHVVQCSLCRQAVRADLACMSIRLSPRFEMTPIYHCAYCQSLRAFANVVTPFNLETAERVRER